MQSLSRLPLKCIPFWFSVRAKMKLVSFSTLFVDGCSGLGEDFFWNSISQEWAFWLSTPAEVPDDRQHQLPAEGVSHPGHLAQEAFRGLPPWPISGHTTRGNPSQSLLAEPKQS